MADNRFKKFANVITDDFPLSDDKPRKDSKFLRPGLYNDCVITKVEDKGPSEKDPDWIKFTISIQVNDKEMWHFVQVPTKSLLFGDKKTDAPFRTLQKFSEAIGVELTKDNVPIVLEALFGMPERLVGFRVDVVLGHDAYYTYPDGHGKVLLRSRDDKPIMSEDGVNPIRFTDFAAAKLYCTTNNLAYSPFVKIKFINPPLTKNNPEDVNKLFSPPEASKKKASTCPF